MDSNATDNIFDQFRMDMDMMASNPNNTAKVSFTIIDPDLKEEREIYTYGWDSFTADFGGYLGLLLGLSVLKLYDIAFAAAKMIIRKC
jgi:hypothetical protein